MRHTLKNDADNMLNNPPDQCGQISTITGPVMPNKKQKYTMQDMDGVELALFGVQNDLRKAYDDGDTAKVTNRLMDILEEKMPERELKFLADYFNSRYNHE